MHPHVILGGTSLDLPMIEESLEEDPAAIAHEVPDSDSDGDGVFEHDDLSRYSEEPEDEFSYHRERVRSGGVNYSDPIDAEDNPNDDVDQSGNAADDDNSNAIDDASNPLIEVQEIQEVVEVYTEYEPMPGPSSAPDDLPTLYNPNDAKNSEIKAFHKDRSWPVKVSIHQSLLLHNETIVADNDLAAESRGLKKSQSTQHFSQTTQVARQKDGDDGSVSDESSSAGSLINPLSLGSHIMDDDSDSPDEIEDTCDTNIRHNDQYPEANEMNDSNEGYDTSDAIDDNFDNVFIDAMFLETSNMPDLNDEQSLSADDSTTTRRDDWADGLTVENLHYLNGIICWDQRVTGARVEHRDWVFYSETNGNCEVMHLALKFWNQIIAPYSDMREVVTSGNVHCFCNNCHPDADSLYTGNKM